MNEVRDFLQNNKNFSFNDGFSLLERYCANFSVVSFISRKRDINYLRYELAKLARMPKLRTINGVRVIETEQRQNQAAEELQEQVSLTAKKSTDEPEVVRWNDIKHHENTKYEDMPTDYLKRIYIKNRDDYKELQYAHLRMKIAKNDADRAEWRKTVLDLADLIDKNWKIIDDEIHRISGSGHDESIFKETTCRSYISKKLSKKNLKPEDVVEIRKRFEQLKSHGCAISEETIKKLQNIGVI